MTSDIIISLGLKASKIKTLLALLFFQILFRKRVGSASSVCCRSTHPPSERSRGSSDVLEELSGAAVELDESSFKRQLLWLHFSEQIAQVAVCFSTLI